jgi:hypothetical protein
MSKELEALDKIAKQIELDEDTDFWEIRNAHKTVEQALLKAQEQEKVLDIIFEKEVDLRDLKAYFKLERGLQEYNRHQYKENELTEEEFDLLKRWLGR